MTAAQESDPLYSDVSEDDLAIDIGPDSTVTWGTDWTVATIIDQLSRERFDLEPAFQRRDVWTAARKSQLIESFLLGVPIPQITLAERQGTRGRFIVLDGKQRLRALQHFAGINTQPLKLTGLNVLTNLNGVTYDDLKNDPDLDSYLAVLENQAIRAVVLRGWRNESLLYLTFMRLNSNVVGLSPQELRRAIHPGPFMDYVVQKSSDSAEIRHFMGIKAPDFRMRDAEILIRHIALSLALDTYRGNLKAFLDEFCKHGNDSWPAVADEVRAAADGLDSAISFTFEIFGNDAFKRATGRGYENRKNRAVLDIMAFYFQHERVRVDCAGRGNEIKEEFRRLCVELKDFSDYLTSTTKSVSAVHGRLRIWGGTLQSFSPSISSMMP
ncbi:DUF262 domain-containing protein [Dactylosporangium sp. McL0621]|uniref:DUF262 domain-containing protein n=1 Tax=Dactylosporangium sp. McL0621 TaxID=3415678 RepID=UPI003CF1AD36